EYCFAACGGGWISIGVGGGVRRTMMMDIYICMHRVAVGTLSKPIALIALSGLAAQLTVYAQLIPACVCQVWNAEEIRINKGWWRREGEREVNLTWRSCARAANPLTCVQRVQVRQVFVGGGGWLSYERLIEQKIDTPSSAKHVYGVVRSGMKSSAEEAGVVDDGGMAVAIRRSLDFVLLLYVAVGYYSVVRRVGKGG
ncbi:unnamed protein product, partial [Ectocarpus sp. 12 AP-2014]